MPKYRVEYYMASTQTEDIEAASEEAASNQVIGDLAYQHQLMDRPTDMVFGVRSVEEIED
jgi:hypothetical protein